MDKADLETYQVQLEQVETALQADPDNAELSSLQSELKELINLTQQALTASASTAAASSSSKPKAGPSAPAARAPAEAWNAGDDCLARYSGDNQWYPARIVSVGGAADRRMYSISFKGYDSTELVDAGVLKPMPTGAAAAHAPKRKLTKGEEEERDRKKKKNEKKLEVRAAKAKDQAAKQTTWQKFAKKSERKGIHIAGTSGTSIFKTPENPLGKGARFQGKCFSLVLTLHFL